MERGCISADGKAHLLFYDVSIYAEKHTEILEGHILP